MRARSGDAEMRGFVEVGALDLEQAALHGYFIRLYCNTAEYHAVKSQKFSTLLSPIIIEFNLKPITSICRV